MFEFGIDLDILMDGDLAFNRTICPSGTFCYSFLESEGDKYPINIIIDLTMCNWSWLYFLTLNGDG